MTIKLSAREYNQLQAAADVLEKYSQVYSAIIQGVNGMHHDTAGTALNMINEILKDNE